MEHVLKRTKREKEEQRNTTSHASLLPLALLPAEGRAPENRNLNLQLAPHKATGEQKSLILQETTGIQMGSFARSLDVWHMY